MEIDGVMALGRRRERPFSRWILGVLFVVAGALHFMKPHTYQRIVPPGFPDPSLLVVVSGVCEIAGGLGVLNRRLRRPAGWGLIALLIAVFPANIYMAFEPRKFPSIPTWLLWIRLPLQGVLIAWVYAAAIRTRLNQPIN
jgi:uncharacterized membrane protein